MEARLREGEGCVQGVGGPAGGGEGLRQVVASMRWSGGGGNNLHFLFSFVSFVSVKAAFDNKDVEAASQLKS